jgi:hypothetical protein
VDLGSENHAVHELSLLETLVDQEIVLLMHGTVAALARSLEDLEPASQTIYTLIIISLTWQSSRCSM